VGDRQGVGCLERALRYQKAAIEKTAIEKTAIEKTAIEKTAIDNGESYCYCFILMRR
jgi:hypothetical protein